MRGLGKLQRRSLRSELHERLRREITDGGIPPSSRVSEADLARLAGVSRTPVREALLLLEAEGFVQSDAGRGFSTSPLSIDEAAETYPILAGLECLALEIAGVPDRGHLDELERLNRELGRVSNDPARGLDLDEQWHTLLLQDCGNRRLQAEIRRMKALVRRYEMTYMRDEGRIATSVGQHGEIVEALRANRGDDARDALRRNWSVTFEQLAPWLRRRSRRPATLDPGV